MGGGIHGWGGTTLTIATWKVFRPAVGFLSVASVSGLVSFVSVAVLSGCGDNSTNKAAESSSESAESSNELTLASCSDMVYHQRDLCPEKDNVESSVASCERLRSKYEPIGCGGEYAEFVLCRSNAVIDCETGDADECDPSKIFGPCASAFASSTLCSRNMTKDGECSGGFFYFNCMSAIPEACSVLAPTNLGNATCCPSFDTSGDVFFKDAEIDPADQLSDAGS